MTRFSGNLKRPADVRGSAILILDLRSYPKAFLPFVLVGHFVDRPTEFMCTTRSDLTDPRAFVWTRPDTTEPLAPRFDRPIVILVDQCTQCLAEFTAMALQTSPGAVVVGSTTAGADGNTSSVTLTGGYRGTITGIGIFYPDRRTPGASASRSMWRSVPPSPVSGRAGTKCWRRQSRSS